MNTPPDGRAKQIDTVYGLVAQTMRERTTKEWLDLFGELEIPATPINRWTRCSTHPQLNAAGMFETVQTSTGPVRFPGVPTWFSRTPGRVRGPAPGTGCRYRRCTRRTRHHPARNRGSGIAVEFEWDSRPTTCGPNCGTQVKAEVPEHYLGAFTDDPADLDGRNDSAAPG